MANINEPLQFVMEMSYNRACKLEQKCNFNLRNYYSSCLSEYTDRCLQENRRHSYFLELFDRSRCTLLDAQFVTVSARDSV